MFDMKTGSNGKSPTAKSWKATDVEFFGNPKPSRVIRRMKVATAHFAEEAI